MKEARSLSSEWQVTRAGVEAAPTWDGEGQEGEGEGEGRGWMLRVEGVGCGLGGGDGDRGDGMGEGVEELEGLVLGFEERMRELRGVLGGGGGDWGG